MSDEEQMTAEMKAALKQSILEAALAVAKSMTSDEESLRYPEIRAAARFFAASAVAGAFSFSIADDKKLLPVQKSVKIAIREAGLRIAQTIVRDGAHDIDLTGAAAEFFAVETIAGMLL